MYSDRRGTEKTTLDQTFQTKDSLTTPPEKNPSKQLGENFYKGLLTGFFVLGLLKIWGSEMCDALSGGPGMCDTV